MMKLKYLAACAFAFGLGLTTFASMASSITPPSSQCIAQCEHRTCPQGCSLQQYLACQFECN
jgi:hypothetical protein